MRESFLRDRKQMQYREEGPRLEEMRRVQDVSLYLEIREEAKNADKLLKILEDVERRAVRYRATVNTNISARIETRQDRAYLQALVESETQRRSAHDALIAEVNLLSRQFKEAGLGNEWRRKIGLEREDVGRWGQSIAGLIYRKFEEIHDEY